MKVNVYLSYYNGSEYIDEQINSLLNQKGIDVRVFIRDDGSREQEAAYIDKFCIDKRISIIHGENFGFGKSFMWLASNIEEKADFYAFCDQDDVWFDFKLKEACEKIKSLLGPVAYSAQPKYVDDKLNVVDEFGTVTDAISYGEKTIEEALEYQLFGLGCTFVWNNDLNDILKKIDFVDFSFSHDNFLSVLTPFIGVFYRDELQAFLYRQHSRNVSGCKKKNKSFLQKVLGKWNNFSGNKGFLLRKYILENVSNFIQEDKLEKLRMSVEYRKNVGSKLRLVNLFLLDNVNCKKKIKNLLMIAANRY